MLKRYLQDTSGNFAMILAISTMVILAAVGAAVDYSSMTRQSSLMQDYADSAVLAAVISRKTEKTELQKIAKTTVEESYKGTLAIQTTLTMKEDSVRVETSSIYTPLFMGMLGNGTYTITEVAEAPLASSDPLNISLVLDVTGSMSGERIASMQKSAKRLVKSMEDQDNDKIKISVVPFADYVNVGVSNRNKKWMAVPLDETIAGTENCYMHKPLLSKSGCTTNTTTSTYPSYTTVNDGVTTTHPGGTSTQTTETCTNYEYGPEEEVCYTPADQTITWNGCVGSRLDPYHKRSNYAGNPIPGIPQINCSAELLTLTNNYSKVRSKINSLTANGETYIPSGLMWGWRTLTPKQPFTQSKNDTNETVKALILMSDGANTKSLSAAASSYGSISAVLHNGTDGDAADALSKTLCNRIKADEIQVYTVAYQFDGANANNTKKMLKKCATSQDHFFDAKNASELDAAFDSIASSLYKVRISL